MKVLIIIPAYNEAENIEKTVNDVIQNTDYDYVVVNDCSKDNTKEVCEKNNFNILNNKVIKEKSKSDKKQVVSKIFAFIMLLLMVFASCSTCIYYVVATIQK